MNDRKIALPIKNKQLSTHFEKCSEFAIFTVVNKKSIRKDLLPVRPQPGIYPHWLAEIGVTDVITKEIEIQTVNKFNKFKISVFAGVEADGPEQLVKELLNGKLETNTAL